MDKQEKDTLEVNIQIATQQLNKIRQYITQENKQKAVTSLKEVIHNLERTVEDVGGRLQLIQENEKTDEVVSEVDRYALYIGLSSIIFEGILPTFTYSILIGVIVGLLLAYFTREATEEIMNGDDNE